MQNTTAAVSSPYTVTLKMDRALSATQDCSALLLETLEGDAIDDIDIGEHITVDHARVLGAAENAALRILQIHGVSWSRQSSYVRNRVVWAYVVRLTPYIFGATELDVATAITDALERLGLE